MTGNSKKGFLIDSIAAAIEWGNRRLTLAKWLFGSNKLIFWELEWMMVALLALCGTLLFTIHLLPKTVMILVAILLAQRLIEFFIVYSRNFVFHKGRIFSDFHSPQRQGEWLIVMFGLNVLQLLLIFAIWYRILSFWNPNAFSQPLGVLNSLYFSVITFLTVGYGDIIPLAPVAKILVMIQSLITFYIIVIVINGLISIHYKDK